MIAEIRLGFKIACKRYMKVNKRMVKQRLRALLSRLAEKQNCPKKLSRSFCMGTYIAFSPFIGLHTVMIFLLSWAFGLECTAVFAAAWLINNPWTMLPVYALDYKAGNCILTYFCGPNTAIYNPEWMQPITIKVANLLGTTNISVWSFVVGGNILGLIFACLLYPFIKRFFEQLVRENTMKQKDL